MAATDSLIETWERQIEESDDQTTKDILRAQINAYRAGVNAGRVAASSSSSYKFNPNIGKSSKDGIRMSVFVLGQSRTFGDDDKGPKKETKKDNTKESSECDTFTSAEKAWLSLDVVRILPFYDVEGQANIKKINNDYTLVVEFGDGSLHWATDSIVKVSIYGSHTFKTNSWHVLDGIRFERNYSTKTEQTYTNIKCKSISYWDEAPTHLQMCGVIERFYSGNNFPLRALPLSCMPKREEVLAVTPKGDDDKYKYDEANKICGQMVEKNVDSFIIENSLPPNTFGEYRRFPTKQVLIPFASPGVRKFPRLPVRVGDVDVACSSVGWAEKLHGDKSEAAMKRVGTSPFPDQVAANAQIEVSVLTFDNDRRIIDQSVFIVKTTMFSPLAKAMGIMDMRYAAPILPEIVHKVHLSLMASVAVPEACTMDINTTVAEYTDTEPKLRKLGVPLKVMKTPLVPIVTMVRSVGAQVSAAYAIKRINIFIKNNGGTVKTESACNLATIEASRDEAKTRRYEWCRDSNDFMAWSNKCVVNLFDTPVQLKLGRAEEEWRFYSVSNAVFSDVMNTHIKLLLEHHETGGVKNAGVVDKFFDAELQQVVDGSETEHFNTPRNGDPFCQVIFAVRREIDYVDVELYNNPVFNVSKKAAAAEAAATTVAASSMKAESSSSSSASSSSDAPPSFSHTSHAKTPRKEARVVVDDFDDEDGEPIGSEHISVSGRPSGPKNVKKRRT